MRQPVDSTPSAARDVPVDEVYIPPPDYSMSEELMAIPPGILVYKLRITEFRCRIVDFCMYRCAVVDVRCILHGGLCSRSLYIAVAAGLQSILTHQ